MKHRKLRVGVAGARWLGVNCLLFLRQNKSIEIPHICFPEKKEKVWWNDVVDEDETRKMGFKITPWKEWQNLEFDLVFSVLHGRIFKSDHLKNSKLGVINLHPAPLPKYRGCNSYAHAIMNGESEYGVTMHYVDEGIDDGPIIAQNVFKIDKRDSGYSLYRKSQVSAFALFKKFSPKIIELAKEGKRLSSKVQAETYAHYYKRDSLKNKRAELFWKKDKLYNFIRALDFPPFEPAYFLLNGEKIYLTLNRE